MALFTRDKKEEEVVAGVETRVEEPKGLNLTVEELKEIMSFAIKEAKKPTEEEEQKLATARELLKRKMEARKVEIEADVESRKKAQKNCPHRKPNGKPSIGGQVHGDGLLHMICLRCQFEFTPVVPPPHLVRSTGINWE